MRILIVDDDPAAMAMRDGLRGQGVLCDVAASPVDSTDMLGTVDYVAVLLDPGSRAAGGLQLLRDLRQRRPGIPVIVTAADGSTCAIASLDAGADAHLAKPVAPDILAAHLRAVLRRGGLIGHRFEIGDIVYDPRTLRVTIAGDVVILSTRERQLLELLVQSSGRIITKRYAEDHLFGHSATLGSNAVEVYAHRLRRKLQAAGSSVRIDTARGIGYVLKPGDPSSE